ALLVFYEGNEEDQYQTYFGAFKANYFVNDNLTLKLITSAYHTIEQEYFDIFAQYRLGQVNTNIGDDDLGEVEFSEGIGSQLTHARNDLDAFIVNAEHRGNYKIDEESTLEWSVKYTHEDIRDRLVEYEIIDSAGFSIRPPNFSTPNLQPYQPFEGPLTAFENIRALNRVQIDRMQAFAQYSKRTEWGSNEVFYNIGVRAHNWTVNGENFKSNTQTVFSPRAQFAIKPNWDKDMLFRVAGGLYYQPPFYRELRDSSGVVQPNVKAQKSFHIVFGNEYSFEIWDRPFKLVTEAYYKGLTDVNPYTLENVRIRYRANNNATAYAYGLDMRLNGEFVPGTESWFSFGYLKTEENIENRGFIARPTDQRLKFGALFQDYVPNMPDLKMYLNLVYNTGVPGGSPSYADPYDFQIRLRDYRRADLGISLELVNPTKTYNARWKKKFKELSLGFEIYNMFNNQNSITNTWVRDVYTKRQFAIPNFLTPRVFNLRLSARF
ncbi:MAG: TonB-dependent receptor, partial [Winogradskyella sp.]|nr:TonB-dependent receptor [Winogradskyella sp.]